MDKDNSPVTDLQNLELEMKPFFSEVVTIPASGMCFEFNGRSIQIYLFITMIKLIISSDITHGIY